MKRKFLSIFGLSYFVSVGYMDPGNWATDIAAGSKFGHELIWVLVMSNIIAILLQTLTIYLTKYSNLDLAELCREKYSKYTGYILWLFAQIAIIATDLAELLGSAIALKLLFKIPLLIGILITVLDVFIIMFLENKGFKKLQAIVVALVLTITIAFIVELAIVGIDPVAIALGLEPKLSNFESLILATGMVGATIMPHNLYMQSGLLKRNRKTIDLKSEIKDLIIALNLALIVNASLLILSAQVFHKAGYNHVASIEQAYVLLIPLVGVKFASGIFGFALLLSGQASTITGTLAGQIVMEGFLKINIRADVLRIVTRLCAMVPTVILIIIFGEKEVDNLLILSQVVLSLQLPFALVPLLMGVKDEKLMDGYKVNRLFYTLCQLSVLVITGLNMILVMQATYKVTNNYTISIIVVSIVLGYIYHLIKNYQKS